MYCFPYLSDQIILNMLNDSDFHSNSTNVTASAPLCRSLDSTAVKATKTTAYSVFLALALLGNPLVIAVVYRKRRLRTSVNYFIVNMALSDLLIPLFAMPLRIKDIFSDDNRKWLIDGTLGTTLCKFMPFTENVSLAVSMLSLLVVAVDRFNAVRFPLNPPLLTKKRCALLIVGTWVIAVGFGAPILYTRRLKFDEGQTKCYGTWAPIFDPIQGPRVYFIVLSVCFLAIPNIFLVILYGVVIYSLKRQKALRHNTKEQRKIRGRENRKVIIMLVAVVFLFILAWTPFQIYFVMWLFVYNIKSPCWLDKFLYFSDFLSFSYTALNPIIYYKFNENYRQGFREILRCPSFVPRRMSMTRSTRSTSFQTSASEKRAADAFKLNSIENKTGKFTVLSAV